MRNRKTVKIIGLTKLFNVYATECLPGYVGFVQPSPFLLLVVCTCTCDSGTIFSPVTTKINGHTRI